MSQTFTIERPDGTQTLPEPSPPQDTQDLGEDVTTGVQTFMAAVPISTPRRIAITTLIILANVVQMISNMVGLSAGLAISKSFGAATGPGQANWAAASYPLTQGTFVLISGRLGAVYGHKNVLVAGAVWFIIWSIANGFASNFVFFNATRALSGIGGALIMPNSVALISTTVAPGKMRNISLGFFGASAPIGGYLGSLLAGVVLEFTGWQWIFFILAILGTCIFAALAFLLVKDEPVDRHGKIDWIGAALGTSALIVFNVAWNQAPAAGWQMPYIIILLVVSLMLMVAFGLWEAKGTKHPIMPVNIWTAPSFVPLLLTALSSYMSNGILLWYMIAWLQLIRGFNVLETAVQWTPFVIFAVLGTLIAAWLIPRLAAQWIMAIGCATIAIANVLLATMPAQQTYWAQVFPATVLMAFCPDLVYTASQIITSNSVKRHQQGVACSLVGTLNLYGTSLGLGFAGTLETQVVKHSKDFVIGYRAALYFGAAIAFLALLLDAVFVRVVKDEREGWTEQDRLAAADILPEGASTGTELRTLGP